jgi:glycosyltransferase involved in cell wall biosynthesis
VRAVSPSHSIDLFHDQAEVSTSLPASAFPIEQLPLRAAGPLGYDAVIYQMGNAPAHDFMYDWMKRVPGLVVLHDLVLHHSYARRYLESPESRAYAADPSSGEKRLKAEEQHRAYQASIDKVYPGLGERLKDAHLNSTGDLLPYAFPMFEPALAHARAVGAHNAFMVEAVQTARPDLSCARLAMPVEPQTVVPGAAAALRRRLGLTEDAAVVGCFGLLTREKRIENVARAIARVAEIRPNVHWLLVGPVEDPAWLSALLERTGTVKRTIVAGRLGRDEFNAAMAITDAVVHLRYPTARETSAALLRVLVQGRPVIISDIANQSEIPDEVVRRVDPCDEEGEVSRAIDALLGDPAAALAMGERASRYARAEHSNEKTRKTYERLLNFASPDYSGRIS